MKNFIPKSELERKISIDLYNIVMSTKGNEKNKNHNTICLILKERGDIDLLYSIAINL